MTVRRRIRADAARRSRRPRRERQSGGSATRRRGRRWRPRTRRPADRVARAGLNRVTWNLAYPGATTFPGMILWGATTNGPAALPGTYQVRLTVDGRAQTQPLVVKKHPLRTITDADLQEQFDLGDPDPRQGQRSEQRGHPDSQDQARDRRSAGQVAGRAAQDRRRSRHEEPERGRRGDLPGAGTRAARIRSTSRSRSTTGSRPCCGSSTRGDGKPIANAAPIFKDLSAELKVQTDRLQQVLSADLPAFNAESERLGLGALAGK